jgi:3-phosphoshikimate 1-carboxyvinyltransferase
MKDMREKLEIREVHPAGPLDAVVRIPGSKSLTQRALVIAALAEGPSILHNVLCSEDTACLIRALRDLGVEIQADGEALVVQGTGGRILNPGREIFLGNNGTATRFLASLVCLGQGTYTLTGEARLCERPVGPLLENLTRLGAGCRFLGRPGCAPLEIRASSLSGGHAVFREVESSQFISSLLLAAPYAREEITIEAVGPILSRPYIDMTLRIMEQFGVSVREDPANRFRVPCSRYSGREYGIEADGSSASYFFLAAALCGGSVRVEDLPAGSQGDLGFLEILEKVGCTITRKGGSIEVRGGSLRTGEQIFPMGHMPDMVPSVAALAACRPGRTVIDGVPHLRFKESDRLSALSAELRKTGVWVRELTDGIIIEGGGPKGVEIETYRDHRIAMSFAVLGLAAPGMRIRDPGCVGKSFPDFWERLETLYP